MRIAKQQRQRLDTTLVDRGLAPSREKARALILAGDVTVGGNVETRASALVATTAAIAITQPARFVSRGGEKLDHALTAFDIDIRARTCADIGASTGGFTDCLLRRGATRVYAIDVGYGQLDQRLRNDPRVVVMERTNARDLESLPEQPSLATIDASFISITKLLPAVRRITAPNTDIVVLVKPQFEAGREEVNRRGVVRDPLVHATVIGRVAWWCVNNKLRIRNVTTSPLLGPAGNREFFLHLWKTE